METWKKLAGYPSELLSLSDEQLEDEANITSWASKSVRTSVRSS